MGSFQGVQDLMELHKQEIVAFEDVKDEIFDMVRPNDPMKLTLQDFIKRLTSNSMIEIFFFFNCLNFF